MHMADALLAPAVAATMYAASAVTVGASVKTLMELPFCLQGPPKSKQA